MNRTLVLLLLRTGLWLAAISLLLLYPLSNLLFSLPTPDYSPLPLVHTYTIRTDTYQRCQDCAPVSNVRGDVHTCHACVNVTQRVNITEPTPPDVIAHDRAALCQTLARDYLADSPWAHFFHCGALCEDAIARLLSGLEPTSVFTFAPTSLLLVLALVACVAAVVVVAVRLVQQVRDELRREMARETEAKIQNARDGLNALAVQRVE